MDAIGAVMDVTTSLADCTREWATGGGGEGPLRPSFGNDLHESSYDTGRDALGELIDATETEWLSGGFGAATDAVDLTNLMTSGLGGYLREPGEAWASIVDIGSCLEDTGRAAGDAVLNVGR